MKRSPKIHWKIKEIIFRFAEIRARLSFSIFCLAVIIQQALQINPSVSFYQKKNVYNVNKRQNIVTWTCSYINGELYDVMLWWSKWSMHTLLSYRRQKETTKTEDPSFCRDHYQMVHLWTPGKLKDSDRDGSCMPRLHGKLVAWKHKKGKRKWQRKRETTESDWGRFWSLMKSFHQIWLVPQRDLNQLSLFWPKLLAYALETPSPTSTVEEVTSIYFCSYSQQSLQTHSLYVLGHWTLQSMEVAAFLSYIYLNNESLEEDGNGSNKATQGENRYLAVEDLQVGSF